MEKIGWAHHLKPVQLCKGLQLESGKIEPA